MDSGIFLSDALAAPGNGSRGKSHQLLEPRLSEGHIRMGRQLPGANTGWLTPFNTAQKAAAGHF